ncbi:MAG: NAD-dependent protein deacylase [Planctomycetaceae bacterium]|nr:NAD-dependent protein deacylase [Planctomycetaceae bacterium]
MQKMTDAKTCAQVFVERLRASSNSVVLTGAGISTASGIPDFRGPSGLYSKISARTFELDFFHQSPAEYYRLAVEYIHPLSDRRPNPAHLMLSRLESAGLLKAVITQNIDGLHRKAGSTNVIEFHGTVDRFHCTRCEKEFRRGFVDEQIRTIEVPVCDGCGGLIRPDIVFFGDPIPPDIIFESQQLAESCDFFITMGSSLEVQPASSLAVMAKRSGGTLCIVNLGPTYLDSYVDLRLETDLTTFAEHVMALL